MTRKEHLDWAKERAYEYLDKGNALLAWTSFTSDMSKHDELKNHIALELGNMILPSDAFAINEYRKFIEGFN